ncbi:MAG TPA: hypothetical protein VM935_15995 [Chitinophagaceae bacterium]|nr:hypothetical protein [Chitinophagaceae bacterium]
MDSQKEPVQALEEIKQMMDRSSRFVSLSGWSSTAAGICALIATGAAHKKFNSYSVKGEEYQSPSDYTRDANLIQLDRELLVLAVITFTAAFLLAFLFTYLRSRKTGAPIWGFMARKVMVNMALPMIVGGVFIWRLTDFGVYGLVAPASLLFYGLALINASKFTISELRYLGYMQLLLGIVNLWATGYGLYFWAAGFGLLHIIYGLVIWNKYERNEKGVA